MLRGVVFFLALFVFLAPVAASANSAISCHCFQNRAYNPAQPAAADPYLLATTQNSLMAATFGLNKRELVRAKMAGTPGEELWVAHYLAESSGQSSSRLLASHKRTGSWQETVAALELAGENLSPLFAALLQSGAGGEALAAVAAEEVLTTRLAIEPEVVEQIRSQGGSTPEIILAAYLGRKSNRSPLEIFAEVSEQNATWGGMLDQLGGTAAEIEEDLSRFLQ